MRPFALVALFLSLPLAFSLVLAGCGNDSQASVGEPVKVELSPTTLSLARGDVSQISARVLDANNNQVFTSTVTFASSNEQIVTVSPSGAVCAGKWDATFIVCATTENNVLLPAGTANLTASSGSLTSDPTVVIVHERIDRVELEPDNPGCVSQGAADPGNKLQFTATAFSNDLAACQRITGQPNPAVPCIVADVGKFNWSLTQPSVGDIGESVQPAVQADNQITVAAKAPGRTDVVANITGVFSEPSTFNTCAAASINIHLKDAPTAPDTPTSFTVAPNASKTLAADVADINGVAFTTTSFLTWISQQTLAVTVNTAGLATGLLAGGSSPIVAACLPPSCNAGLSNFLYSNVVMATVSGTAATTTVYATTAAAPAAGASTPLVPIDTANNTAGTAINLTTDATVNSMLISRQGTRVYLGSDKGLIFYDVGANTVATPQAGVLGKVLAISADGARLVVADATNSDVSKRQVYIVSSTGAVEQTLAIPNATAAAFTPDGGKTFIVGGDKLHIIRSGGSPQTFTIGSPASDVASLVSGQFAYAASPGIDEANTCNNAVRDLSDGTPELIATAALVQPAPNEKLEQVMAVNSPQVTQIDVDRGTSTALCPPAPAISSASHGFAGIGGFAARQIIVTPDQKRVLILTDQSSVLVYNVGTSASAGTTSTIPLDDGAVPTSGGVTLDSKTLFVGASDNKVHRIELTANDGAGDDVAQTSLSFTPQLVVVRPR